MNWKTLVELSVTRLEQLLRDDDEVLNGYNLTPDDKEERIKEVESLLEQARTKLF